MNTKKPPKHPHHPLYGQSMYMPKREIKVNAPLAKKEEDKTKQKTVPTPKAGTK